MREIDLTVRAADGGGYELQGRGFPGARICADDTGWRIDAASGPKSWYLSTDPGDGSAGITLVDRTSADPVELGRLSFTAGTPADSAGADLITADGRVFRMQVRPGISPRFELTGWEVPGAYLTAEPLSDGWRIKTTVAGAELDEDGTLLYLFAAGLIGL